MRRLPAVLVGILALAAVVIRPTVAEPARQETQPLDPAKVERGIKVFAAQRCSSCHAIAGSGNRRYPLDGVGSRLTRLEIQTWIVAPQKMNPRVRKRAYELEDRDLDDLVTYLLSLKEAK